MNQSSVAALWRHLDTPDYEQRNITPWGWLLFVYSGGAFSYCPIRWIQPQGDDSYLVLYAFPSAPDAIRMLTVAGDTPIYQERGHGKRALGSEYG